MARQITRRRLATKFGLMPDRMTIEYSARQMPGTGWHKLVSIEDCEKRWPTRKDQESANAQIRTADMIWFAWQAKLKGIKPVEGDRIGIDGEMWTVNYVRQELLGQRFRLYCKKGIV